MNARVWVSDSDGAILEPWEVTASVDRRYKVVATKYVEEAGGG